MTKEELMALGLTEEQATKILSKYDGMIPKTRFNEVVEEKNNLKTQLAERDKQLTDLSKNKANSDELKKQIETMQAENKAKADEYEKNISQIKLDNALEIALMNAGSKNTKAVKALLNMENIKLDNDKLVGIDEQLSELTKTSDYLFESKEPAPTAPKGTTPGVSNKSKDDSSSPISIGGALKAIYNNN